MAGAILVFIPQSQYNKFIKEIEKIPGSLSLADKQTYIQMAKAGFRSLEIAILLLNKNYTIGQLDLDNDRHICINNSQGILHEYWTFPSNDYK